MRKQRPTNPPASRPAAAPDPYADCERHRITETERAALEATEGALRAALQRQALIGGEIKARLGLPLEVQIVGLDKDGRLLVRMKPA